MESGLPGTSSKLSMFLLGQLILANQESAGCHTALRLVVNCGGREKISPKDELQEIHGA